ncbi:MAG: response regulator transcription factor [Clostridia bacterium]|nr:response regulator transcription factor [Clostridia bacterium]
MKVLIIEDDKILSNTIKQIIEKNYDVEQAFDGEEGVLYGEQNIYDVIILDLMMPIKNGYEVLAELRKNKIYTPVLILTAKDSLNDKLKGFEVGADDYLVKPFEKDELLARINAMIRRNNRSFYKDEVVFKDLKLDLSTRKAYIKNKEITLQGKQFDMLEYLINYKNKIITKDQIFDKIWGFDSDTSTTVVEVYASGIRKELKKHGYDKYLKTIRGGGYMISE